MIGAMQAETILDRRLHVLAGEAGVFSACRSVRPSEKPMPSGMRTAAPTSSGINALECVSAYCPCQSTPKATATPATINADSASTNCAESGSLTNVSLRGRVSFGDGTRQY